MAYKLEGSLLEVCNCEVLCPCWIGMDPDRGTCYTALAHHFEKGDIDGVDVSGLTMGFTAHIPGNILKGNWRVVVHVDRERFRERERVVPGFRGDHVVALAIERGRLVREARRRAWWWRRGRSAGPPGRPRRKAPSR